MNKRIKETFVFFFALTFFFGASAAGYAMEMTNDSEHRIGVAVLQPQEEREAPIYVKVLQPAESFELAPPVAGPFNVSVMDIDTKEETRLDDLEADAKLSYDGEAITEIV